MERQGRTMALIVAAGSGERAGGGIPKQYRRVGDRTVLAHALGALDHPGIDGRLVVIGEGQQPAYEAALTALPFPLPATITGGPSRRLSVRNGLAALAGQPDVERVLIHDAARPFVPAAVVDRLLGALDGHDGAVPILPVADTLARSGPLLGETIDRRNVCRVQTPQAFRFPAILAAHESWEGGEATDDAQIARAAGMAVATVEGDARLEKLTFEGDLVRAEALHRAVRTGLGFDVHALIAGDKVRLGGIDIPHDRKLDGHSDADVLLHAITDALLGAIGAGDLGDHFPPSDPQWRGAPSSLFLEHARDLVLDGGGRIVHVDAVLICEAPRIAPYRDAMRTAVARLLRVPAGRVSIKATTTERLGFAGRREGIAAQAVASVSLPETP